VVETAESGKRTFQDILALRQEMDRRIVTLGRRAENARRLMMLLYGTPAITVNSVSEQLGLKYYTANQLVSTFTEVGILKEVTGYQRNRIFIFQSYVDIFRGENETK
jgi:Fic family protein